MGHLYHGYVSHNQRVLQPSSSVGFGQQTLRRIEDGTRGAVVQQTLARQRRLKIAARSNGVHWNWDNPLNPLRKVFCRCVDVFDQV